MDRSIQATVHSLRRPACAAALFLICSVPGTAPGAPPSSASKGKAPVSQSAAGSSSSSGKSKTGASNPPSVLPAKPDRKTGPPPGEADPEGVLADPFPSPTTAREDLPPDLLPSEEDDKRAEAIARFALATLTEETEDLDAAFPVFLKALELDPGNARLAVRIAGELLYRKKNEDAIRLLKAAHQAVPREPGPAVELARVYLGTLRQPDNALLYAERAYRIAPDQLSTISTLVDVCAVGRLSQRIEDTLRKTLSLTRRDTDFWLNAGDLFRGAMMLRGNLPAKTQLERLNNLYRKALEIAPEDANCLERTADHFSLTAQYAEACRFYERANTLSRPEKNDAPKNSLQICQKWARALVLNEQPDAAVELLQEVVREHPTAAQPRELLGELQLQHGELLAALAQFRVALDLDASRLEDHVRLIQLQLRVKRAEDAVETATKARARFADAPGLTMLLAMAYGEAKRHEDSLKAFASAEKEFAAKQTEALDASFYLTYGAAAERAGMIEQAAGLLKKSASLDPENAAEALNYLGFMWVDRNMNLEEAGTLIRKALGLRPNYPAYLDSLGWWYYRKGDLSAAARELRRALERIRREEAPEVYDHLGEVLQKSGKNQEAINAWEAALELDPSLESIRTKIEAARKILPVPPPPPAPAAAATLPAAPPPEPPQAAAP